MQSILLIRTRADYERDTKFNNKNVIFSRQKLNLGSLGLVSYIMNIVFRLSESCMYQSSEFVYHILVFHSFFSSGCVLRVNHTGDITIIIFYTDSLSNMYSCVVMCRLPSY